MASAGQVCHAFAEPCRHHLFRSVTLRFDDDSIDELLQIFTPALVSYVRILCIGGANQKIDEETVKRVDSSAHRLPKFHACERLTLSFLAPWEFYSLNTRRWLTELVRGIQSLRFNYFDFNLIGNALRFISSATNLKQLSFGTSEIPNKDNFLTVRMMHPAPPIEDLRLDIGYDGVLPVIFDWLRLAKGGLAVKTLELASIPERHIHGLSDCLRALGPIVEHLRFGFHLDELDGIDFYFLSVSECYLIQSQTVSFDNLHSDTIRIFDPSHFSNLMPCPMMVLARHGSALSYLKSHPRCSRP